MNVTVEHDSNGAPRSTQPRSDDASEPLSDLVTFMPFDSIFEPEPEANLIVPAMGISTGPVNGVIGQSHIGKSITVLSIGLASATGTRVFGVWSTKRVRWGHLDHDQGRRHSKRYVTKLIAGNGLDREQLRGWFELAIYPRLNLTIKDAESYYTELFDQFGGVSIDAFRGLIPGVDENSSEVREYIDMLSRAAEKKDTCVILNHHGGKTPLVGSRPRKEAGRGSMAFMDALQSAFVLTGAKNKPILVSHEKDRELGRKLDDFYLRIEDVQIGNDPRAGFRVVHLDGAQAEPADSVEELIAAVVSIISKKPDCTKRWVRASAKGRRGTDVDAALEEAEDRGLIRNLGSEKKAKYRALEGAQ